MSSLEASITLEDVFTVVEAKRVPLAPELAGYLALEIADGTDAGSGDVDPKTVFISEEGTVALVRPKKDVTSGEAEASVRALLTKLLEASGSGTPALTTAAKRKPGNGLPALVEELEAALIPVNRAAGRRALARLAREVKRVLLGVGRNAQASRGSGEMKPVAAAPHARPPIRKRDDAPKAAGPGADPTEEPPRPPRLHSFAEEPATARRHHDIPDDALGADGGLSTVGSDPAVKTTHGLPGPPGEAERPARAAGAPAAAAARPAEEVTKAPPARVAAAAAPPLPAMPPTPPPPPVPAPAARPPLPPPPATRGSAPAPPPPPKREGVSNPPPAAAGGLPPPTLFGGDEVDSLLDSFGVSNLREDKLVARDLKAIAGLSPTPPPPDATSLAELTKDVGRPRPARPEPEGDGDGVEALLALADASVPLPMLSMGGDDDATPLVRMPPKGLEPAQPESAPFVAAGAAAAPAQPALAPPPPAAPLAPAPAAPAPHGPLPDERPQSARNLPPSPLFGSPGAAASPAVARGAPAALRQAAEASAAVGPRNREREESPKQPAAPSASASATAEPARRAAPAPAASARGKDAAASAAHPTKKVRPRKSAPRTGMAIVVFALLVVAGGTVAIWKFAPQVFTGRRPLPAETTALSAPPPPPPKCKVALVLSDVPANAEILLRMGQAPVDVERMPVGTRLEFVATAEGQSPRRAVIQAEATWDKGEGGKPRIEVPIQLDPSKVKPGAVEPWPVAEPGSQVGGSGAPGTVHVVSNIRGAEVWLLAGLGPEARIDQLRCDADIDVLLAGPPTTPQPQTQPPTPPTPLRKRLHVAEKDIAATAADAQGNKVVSISASSAK